MTQLSSRLGPELRQRSTKEPVLCDLWLEDGRRFPGRDDDPGVLGSWPSEIETDAVLRLGEAVGERATWQALEATPPVAQKLSERAQLQPLDLAILRHYQHLQHVCGHPRSQLRIEEERVPVARARRWPPSAVADLVSHTAHREHRTLRGIQPARLLARRVEDDSDLYENRVAARLVDNLLAYLARRLGELQRIADVAEANTSGSFVSRSDSSPTSSISKASAAAEFPRWRRAAS